MVQTIRQVKDFYFYFVVITPVVLMIIQKYGRNVGGQTVQKPSVAPSALHLIDREIILTCNLW